MPGWAERDLGDLDLLAGEEQHLSRTPDPE
jgi:hypothetical protein